MKKLTKREKILIYILACFLILTAGIYFLLLPGYARYAQVRDQYDEAKYTQTTMEASIDSIPELETSREEGIQKITQKREVFLDALTNEGLDKVLTPLCLSYQLSPKSLSVLNNGYAEIGIFKPVISMEEGLSEEEMAAILDEIDSMGDIDSTEEEETSSEEASLDQIEETTTNETVPEEETAEIGIPILTGVVEMELRGTQINFYRLIDTVASRPDLVIASFEITPVSTKETETISSGTTTTDISYSNWMEPLKGGQSEIKVTFNLYMVEKQGL